MESLAFASVAGSTRKDYLSKFRALARYRAAHGHATFLREADGPEAVVKVLTEFMACRCFAYKDQSQTVRGYLAAIKYFRKVCAGWELPNYAMSKGIDRAHGKSETRPRVRKPLTWNTLVAGKRVIVQGMENGRVVWIELALTFFLLHRASVLFAYGDGLVNSDFCLTRHLRFAAGSRPTGWENRRAAERVQVTSRASKSDQKREGHTVEKTRARRKECHADPQSTGALEVLLDLLDVHEALDWISPLMQTRGQAGWKVIARIEATQAVRAIVGALGLDPQEYALQSWRIGGATQLAAQGASDLQIQRAGRWKLMVFMAYVRAGGKEPDSCQKHVLS